MSGRLDQREPTVTCVITAHNHEEFIVEAVSSALEQTYPAELLDVVVVNDGSRDGTADKLARNFADEPRVRLIDQENRGFVAAMNAALAAATGELIGILDGDDCWPPDRIARQVELMLGRPEVGLVHGDMKIVDRDGNTLNPSFFAYSGFEVPRGRVLARLIGQNFVSGGASLVRARLVPHFHPIPEELVYPDWYIAARVAERAEIDHIQGDTNLYRMHDSNMGLGGTGRKFFADMRTNVRIQRWMLHHLDTSGEPLELLVQAAESMLAGATRAALELDSDPRQILPVGAEDRAAGQAAYTQAEAQLRGGELDGAARGYLRALALDPWDGAARAAMIVTLARIQRGDLGTPVEPPATRPAAVVALADELLGHPEMLSAYAASLGTADVTLLIHCTPAETAAAADALSSLLSAGGFDSPGGPDLLLHPCEDMAELLNAPVRALYSRRGKPAALTTLPRVDDRHLEQLRALVGQP
ncbi:MAG: glycosyltransferase [Solirubrobacteraceae bacterium]